MGKEELMFQNLSQLKKQIKVGDPVKVNNHLYGITEDRIIVKTQTNGFFSGKKLTQDEIDEKLKKGYFATNFAKLNGETYSNVFFEYPKAKNSRIANNKLEALVYTTKMSNGEESTYPSSGLTPGDVWLEFQF